MDAVKAFNSELSSLYEVKPPISKAKMTALTRGAIKAIKFYKHVVQSVEKFILKCKPEYKVPGLYVIDSIVRQSRHQFGSDKDVFAPRFAKNMQQTFVNLYKCPPEDKSKIIRVLNLWQKNQVFAPEVIQPLFDLADPNNPIHKELENATPANGMNNNAAIAKGSPALQKTPTKGSQPGNDVQFGGNNLNKTDPLILAQFQQLQRLLTLSADGGNKAEAVHFDKKLLDFDYGDEEDEVNPSPRPPPASDSVSNILSNPEILRQLQTLQQTMVAGQVAEMDVDKIRRLQEMKQQEDEFDKHLAQTVPNLPFASECEFKPSNNTMMMGGYYLPPSQDLSQPPPNYKNQPEYDISQTSNNGDFGGNNDNGADVEVINLDHDDSVSNSPTDDRFRRRRSRSRERSRDRGRDRDRDRRSRRSRSRSRPRRHRSRSRDRERNRTKEKEKEKETEKDKERKKRGLPAIKKDNLSVCSTTLWVGHLSKLVHQEDLSNTFGEFGDIVSIDLIPPRGCAFIVMHRRQDAARCLNKLKNHILHAKAITLAWAPGKGVKGKDLKDYWEGDLGVSYIPWNKIKENIDLEMLEDGGMIDEDTMPAWMKAKVANMSNKTLTSTSAAEMTPYITLGEVGTSASGTVDTSQPPPMPGAGLLQAPLLPLVSPFQFNNRILGMNVPPGMMPNIPIGVPPPNLQQAMMPNQLLGIGSPFQGAPSIMQQMQMADNKPTGNPETSMKSLSETLMSLAQPFGLVPQPPVTIPTQHDDNMDVEMEDADKGDKPIPLSEQLQASMRQFNRDMPDGHRRDDRGRQSSRSRDRNRDIRDRGDRDRDVRHGSRERRDRDNSRGRDRDRRERGNRWSDRDRRDHEPNERDDRREREKTLNERLKEMAGMNYDEPNRDRPPRVRNNSEGGGMPPPPLIDRPPMFPPRDSLPRNPDDNFMRGPPDNFEHPMRGMPRDDFPPDFGPSRDMMMDRPPHLIMDGPPDLMNDGPPDMMIDGPPLMMDGPPNMMMDGPPDMMDGPPDMMMDGPPDMMMDGPPHMRMDGPHPRMHPRDDMEPERFGRGRRDFRDDFEPRMRGPPGPPGHDFFPPRDEFGPPRPIMRGGPGPDFGPRGPPMMRPPGPRGFFPRGPPMRGPRPGPPWKERPTFNPRFDGPPDFFRGPGGPPMFNEPPHIRHRGPRFGRGRHDFNPDFHEGPPMERPERRSRWGGGGDAHFGEPAEINLEEGGVEIIEISEKDSTSSGKGGGNTPLRDEVPPQQETEKVVEAEAIVEENHKEETSTVKEDVAPGSEEPAE